MAPIKRALWSEESLQRALDSIKNGMAVLRASEQYGIPRRTLRNHLLTGSNVRKLGRGSLLSREQETELCNRIFRLAEVGMPLTSRVLRRSVYTFVVENNITHKFNQVSRMAGRKWMHLFYKRNPDVAQRKVQFLNPARAQKLNRHIVGDYFSKLEGILLDLNLMNEPQKIFNMDEKGCRLTIHHQQKVLSKRGIKRVHMLAQEHAENVTVVACGNAVGQAIPPMILFKGKRKKNEWVDSMPPGTAIEMTQRGSMTAETFVIWIQHFGKYKPPGRCLLIFDGASSHLDANIVTAADVFDITLFCLPSNTTHELQPLDKSVFRSFEYYWDEEVLQFWTRNPDRKITKMRFGEILSKVWPKAMSPNNLMAGFRATGIFPFDKNILPDTAFAPSTLTEINIQEHQTAESDTNNQFQKDTQKNRDKNTKIRYKAASKNKVIISDSDDSDYTLHDSSEADSHPEDSDSDNMPLINLISHSPTQLSGSRVRHVTPPPVSCSPIQHSTPQPQCSNPQPSTSHASPRYKNNIENVTMESNSFSELLPTPVFKTSTKGRRKALNSTAQVVVKSLFDQRPVSKKQPPKLKKQPPKGPKKNKEESWFCFICQRDEKLNMRLCMSCMRYIHEDCVGLTKKDKLPFICPECLDN